MEVGGEGFIKSVSCCRRDTKDHRRDSIRLSLNSLTHSLTHSLTDSLTHHEAADDVVRHDGLDERVADEFDDGAVVHIHELDDHVAPHRRVQPLQRKHRAHGHGVGRVGGQSSLEVVVRLMDEFGFGFGFGFEFGFVARTHAATMCDERQ